MDPTFYDDNISTCGQKRPMASVVDLKAGMTLSIPSASQSSATDTGVFRLTSPELERFIVHQEPKAASIPTAVLFPKLVTREQEEYAKGFLQALEKLHQSNGQPLVVAADHTSTLVPSGEVNQDISLTSPIASYSVNFSNFERGMIGRQSVDIPKQSLSTLVQNEMPQTVPCIYNSSPCSPEGSRLELKRARNRIAAQKCRIRKIERIAELSERVNQLKAQNSLLLQTSNELQKQLEEIKRQLIQHVANGCRIMVGNSVS